MKPILIDLKDMSDSSEVYESRPHPFFIWFIYLLIAMTMAAIIWSLFFQVDIVVSGMGTIVAKEDSAIITNTHAGIVTACYIQDGQVVEKGDLLYEVEHEQLKLELTNYESQKIENDNRLVMMNAYLDWLYDNRVSLDEYVSNPYFTEYSARMKLVSLNVQSLKQEYKNEQNNYDAKLQANGNLVAYYEGEIDKLKQLSNGVKNRTNPFQSNEEYYYAKMNDYLTQYHNMEVQYDEKISSAQQEMDEALNKITAANADVSEADAQMRAAQSAMAANPDNLEQVQAMQESANAATIKKSQLEAQIKAEEEVAVAKKEALSTASVQKQTALSNLETTTIAAIEASILTNQQNLLTCQGNQTEAESGKDNSSQTGTAASIENVTQTEIQSVTAEISVGQEKQEELETSIAGIKKTIDETSIVAPASGTINLSENLVTGNYLSAGASVMTIIPQEEVGYMVKAYIENKDIAKISKGMCTKYEIAAYPSSEYGSLTGVVEFVSADLKASDETGSAYYMVETTIDNSKLYNASGEPARLKVGMLCETRIIVEQKSVLRYLLEKIKLLD